MFASATMLQLSATIKSAVVAGPLYTKVLNQSLSNSNGNAATSHGCPYTVIGFPSIFKVVPATFVNV
jgi:hypothetical protein